MAELGSGALLGGAAGAIAEGGFRPPELSSICVPDFASTTEPALVLEDHVELRETVSVVSPAEEFLCASSGVTTETRVPDGAETFTLPAAPELQWLDEVHAIRILVF